MRIKDIRRDALKKIKIKRGAPSIRAPIKRALTSNYRTFRITEGLNYRESTVYNHIVFTTIERRFPSEHTECVYAKRSLGFSIVCPSTPRTFRDVHFMLFWATNFESRSRETILERDQKDRTIVRCQRAGTLLVLWISVEYICSTSQTGWTNGSLPPRKSFWPRVIKYSVDDIPYETKTVCRLMIRLFVIETNGHERWKAIITIIIIDHDLRSFYIGRHLNIYLDPGWYSTTRVGLHERSILCEYGFMIYGVCGRPNSDQSMSAISTIVDRGLSRLILLSRPVVTRSCGNSSSRIIFVTRCLRHVRSP